MTDSSPSSGKMEISLTVNDQPTSVHAYPMERLLDVLRNHLALTGVKEGCGEGECGSCSVLMNGALVNSCLVPVLQASESDIVTVEGLDRDGQLNAVQQAFLDCGGAQCGICTPGMILATVHLLRKTPQPALEEIREALSGNLCRCTGYMQIFEAVAEASRRSGSS